MAYHIPLLCLAMVLLLPQIRSQIRAAEQTAVEALVAAPPCDYNCKWTDWLDRDNPSGVGDYELLQHHRTDGSVDPNATPISTECRRVSDQMRYDQVGENLIDPCNEHGLSCKNEQQPDGSCEDYEVRYHTCEIPPGLDCVWTDWLDRDNPSGDGDFEDLHNHKHDGLVGAAATPVATECRRVSDHMSHDQVGENLIEPCTELGLACRNKQQPDGSCEDYEVRYHICPCKEVSCDVACEFGFLTNSCCCHDCQCHNPCHNSRCWSGTACLAIRCHSYPSCRHDHSNCYQTLCIPDGCFKKPDLCQGTTPMWTFDASTRTCSMVKSCHTNPSGNLFASYYECRSTCYPVANHWYLAQEEPAYADEVVSEDRIPDD